MSPLIQIYQTELNQTRFWSESLTDTISFYADNDKESGILISVETNKKSTYSLRQENSSAIIESTFFSNKSYYITTTPLGFNLSELEDKSLYLKFIEDFWINHQEVINAILSFISSEENMDRNFTVDEIAKAVVGTFDQTTDWNTMVQITERIMDMLIKDQSVFKGQKQGKPCISASPKTKSFINTKYIFVRH